ncbi:UDP-glucosyltransferase 2-like [Rhopalosiphum padi]|uniref:UDP-glucosyltransferase 2-like n=1 Tax=Rhopalosiphum padi TaxID=40932 RepID=UPI00298DEE24|nr:UDP-glucosyltransferase 2-like [Rhopalosiphum padi]
MRWSSPPSWRSVVVAIVAALACASDAANILAVETMAGMSHWNFMSGVLRALVDNGHAVTAFTPFPAPSDGRRSHVNYTEVDMSRELLPSVNNRLTDVQQMWSTPVGQVYKWLRLSRNACNKIYGHPAMKEALRRHLDGHARFDAVVVEPFLSDCVSYAAGRLRVPLVYVTPLPAIGLMERAHTGHASNPAVASHLVADHGIPRTFAQRLSNAALSAYCAVAVICANAALRYVEPREYDAVPPVTPSLMFVNGHYVSEPSNPVAQSVVHVGGIHLKPPEKLPEDILEFIEQSSHGVIYFTFGSTVKMSSLPEHIKNSFIEVLAQIPQRVLWKYEGELKNKPKNLMIKKWLPQRDILMHPNVKLFISHGGISGLYEAVDAGVPVLGFPLFGDQHRNIDNLVNAGMAISMDLFSVSEKTLLKHVLEIVNNKKYPMNAKTTSNIFKDRPMTPAQSVVYWTEYVLRHNGAPHLKSHSLNLTWFQYYLLDVISFAIILISVVFFAVYKMLKCIYKCTSIFYHHNVKAKTE